MINCLSGSIKRILDIENINISEEILCLDRDLLKIGCKGDKDSISSEIYRTTEKAVGRLGLRLINIEKKDAGNLLNDGIPLIANVSTDILNYATVFKKNNSNISNHFICVEGKTNENTYKIFDSYIPGVIIRQYEGIIEFDNNIFEDVEFFKIVFDGYKGIDTDLLYEELYLINRKEIIMHNKVRYKRMKNSISNVIQISDETERKFCFNNMAAEIGVGGVKESRYAFELLLKYSNTNIVDINRLKTITNDLCNKYILLRLILLKSTIKDNKNLLTDTNRIINEIISLESAIGNYRTCNI